MGQGRVELPTSRLSGVRSNHLSYWPRVASSVPRAGLLPEDGAPDGVKRRQGGLAPWKLNRTRSDDELREIIDGAEWALTLVACFSLGLGRVRRRRAP